MSIPLLIGLLAFVVIIGGLAGVWRARDRGAPTMQSSMMLLVLVLVSAVLIWFVLQGR